MAPYVQQLIGAVLFFRNPTRPPLSRGDSLALFRNQDNQGLHGISDGEIADHYRTILSIPFKEDSDCLPRGIMSKVKEFHEDPLDDSPTKAIFDEVATIIMLEQYFIGRKALHSRIAGVKKACGQHLRTVIDWICRKKGCTRDG